MYLAVTLLSVAFLYLIKAEYTRTAFLLAMLPFVFIYFLVPSLQYDVGTDYLSYVDMYKYGYNIDYYANKNEWVFYYILRLSRTFQLGEQSLFVIVALVYTFFWTFFIFIMNRKKYKLWLIVLLYFCVTGIYQNQLNGLRQYMAIAILPCALILFAERKYIKAALLSCLSVMCHSTFVVVIPMFFVLLLKPTPTRFLLVFVSGFVLSGFFIAKVLPIIVTSYFPGLQGYFESDLASRANMLSILTKLYYLPIIVLFFLKYREDYQNGTYFHGYDVILKLSMFFSATYWLFLVSTEFGFFGRISQYFMILYIFPMYYLIESLILSKKHTLAFFVLCYLIIPYFLKVTVFATSEYLYQSILS